MGKKETWILALAIVAGCSIMGYLVGGSLERFRREDRIVTMRGFSERDVKADLAIWTIRVSVASNDLLEGSRGIDSAESKVLKFLRVNGFDSGEVSQKELRVVDKKAVEYESSGQKSFRYLVTKTIGVRSENVENVLRVSRMTDRLLSAGVVVSAQNNWEGSGPKFLFTKLNDIKPAMLSEAIKNANTAANEFTKESHTTLGKMRRASQGLFTIGDRDDFSGNTGDGRGATAGTNELFKKVRVVISVDYSIE